MKRTNSLISAYNQEARPTHYYSAGRISHTILWLILCTAACAALVYVSFFRPSLDSSDAKERIQAIESIGEDPSDQPVLAHIAMTDEDHDVRLAAVRKLADQALLAEIAVSGDDDVNFIATERLTVDRYLAQVAFDNKSPWSTRKYATERISDPALLAKIALSAPDWVVRCAAIRNSHLTDQTVLEQAATQESNGWALSAVAKKLANKELRDKLNKLFVDDKVELARNILALDNSAPVLRWFGECRDPFLNTLGRSLSKELFESDDLPEIPDGPNIRHLIARLKLASQDPIIQKKLPGIELRLTIEDRVVRYTMGDVLGEYVHLTLLQDGNELVAVTAKTDFPEVLSKNTRFVPAKIPEMKLFDSMFEHANFTEQELSELINSEITEVALAAVSRIAAPSRIRETARTGKYTIVRMAAVRRITDQDFLAKIALEDKDLRVRAAALKGISDQPLLAAVAHSRNSNDLRVYAVSKLTDRALLNEIIARLQNTNSTMEILYLQDIAKKRLQELDPPPGPNI